MRHLRKDIVRKDTACGLHLRYTSGTRPARSAPRTAANADMYLSAVVSNTENPGGAGASPTHNLQRWRRLSSFKLQIAHCLICPGAVHHDWLRSGVIGGDAFGEQARIARQALQQKRALEKDWENRRAARAASSA